jgi:hypothetical protein
MSDPIQSGDTGSLTSGVLTEPNVDNFESIVNSLLTSGEKIQSDIDRQRDMALTETDPIKKAQYTNTYNEAVNALTIQFQLNFLRAGAEIMKLPGVLKNG